MGVGLGAGCFGFRRVFIQIWVSFGGFQGLGGFRVQVSGLCVVDLWSMDEGVVTLEATHAGIWIWNW